MNLFRDYTLSWQQAAMLKTSVLLVGLALGAHFHELIAPYALITGLAGLAVGIYLASVLWCKKD